MGQDKTGAPQGRTVGIMGLEELREQQNGAAGAAVWGTGAAAEHRLQHLGHTAESRNGAGTEQGRQGDMEGTQRDLWDRGKDSGGRGDAQSRSRAGGRCPRAGIHAGWGRRRGQREAPAKGWGTLRDTWRCAGWEGYN